MLAVCQGFDVLALGRVIMGLGVGVGELSLSPSLSFSLSLYVA